MKRLRLASRLVLLGLVLAPAVAADAPIGGPDQQYASFDGSNTVITDRFTKLAWERPVLDPMTFDEAEAHCAALASMRLPSLKELLTIVDEDPHQNYEGTKVVYRYIDEPAFPNTPGEPFWTSSRKGGDAWTVDFGTGETKVSPTSAKHRVRCVDFRP